MAVAAFDENATAHRSHLAKDCLHDLGNVSPQKDETAWDVIQQVSQRALQSLSSDQKLITIGGDHSVAAGSIDASLRANLSTRVVWVDAHGDMNTPESSPTGNLHGMPLAALLRLYRNPLTGPPLPARNLLLLGVRDLDPVEGMVIRTLGIEYMTSRDIRRDRDSAFQKLKSWLEKSNQPVHLSFDVDSLDPSDGPATGIKVSDGLSTPEAAALIKSVQQNSFITAVDIVELNPREANDSELITTLRNLNAIFTEIPFVSKALSDEFKKSRRPATDSFESSTS